MTLPGDALRADALRADALLVLRGWDSPSAAQERLRERYVAHLDAHPDGMTRACTPDHLTASTLVLSHDRARVLLTLHAKARRWFQLGGHCEPGDATLAGAALREAIEESGVEVALDPVPVQLSEHAVPFCGPTGDVHHLDVRYVALAGPDAVHAVSEESLDVAWWPVDALPDAEPDLEELVALALERAQPGSPMGGVASVASAGVMARRRRDGVLVVHRASTTQPARPDGGA